MRRSTLVAAVGAVTLLGAVAWHVDAAWRTRREAFDARDAARVELQRASDTLAANRHRLDQARQDGRRLTAARDGAALSVDQRQAELAATSAERDQASALATSKTAEATVIHQCLDGAGAALDALHQGRPAAAVGALRFVDSVCRAAAASQSGASPQYGFDFPDPFVLVRGAAAYAYATNAAAGNIQVLARSADGAWATAGDALGGLPTWAKQGRTWAPAVLPRDSGYVLYYTVAHGYTGVQCISRALGASPTGPFLDNSTEPLDCGETGAIDPEAVIAPDGTPVLLYKLERPARIVARPLTGDGLAFAGAPVELLHATASWEGGNVEAPSMLVGPGGAWLLFSGNDWNGRRYATGVVHCASVLGPCDAAPNAPLLASHDPVMGPGGASVFRDADGSWHLAYHAYVSPNVGYPASRLLFDARLDLSSGRPVPVR